MDYYESEMYTSVMLKLNIRNCIQISRDAHESELLYT